jgi:NitT/TauT family transport system permease protein
MTEARVDRDVTAGLPDTGTASDAAPALQLPQMTKRSRKKAKRASAGTIWMWRLLLIAILVLAWQYVPEITAMRRVSPIFDPFYVSSPSLIARRIWDISTGHNSSIIVWGYLWATLKAAIIGTVLGTILGGLGGLLLSNNPTVDKVLKPFIVALNATPRIALIPIIIILTGPTFLASVFAATLVVLFIVFYNAFEGGSSIAPHVVDNARLLGAGPVGILLRVRLPLVMAWTFAALPNAVSLGLVSVITSEVLTGTEGLGNLLVVSLNLADATLTFAAVIFMAVTGIVLVTIMSSLRKRLMHWWTSGETQLA